MRILAIVQSLIIAGLLVYTMSLQQQLEALREVAVKTQTQQSKRHDEPQPAPESVNTLMPSVTASAVAAQPVRENLPVTSPQSINGLRAATPAETTDPAEESTDTNTEFERQQIDFSWAPDFSNQLSGMFQQSVPLQTLKIKDIECRNSLCRVQIYNDDMDALRLGVMIGGALEKSGFSDHAYQFATQSENGIFTVYVGRDKNSIQLN